ncbi:hypothetical protein CHU92_15295 [Flavobacterium cyanobacteriorum]|uniref:Carboxypeptidase-like regulatory domain-containing protein n=1 Tax=Flavobacterium cyanobacteriorum TaxID=2022802 RepID=A0A255YRL2_9FLAO|nr:carboxypeptidase-like regulatory domain-containing protein [Flavobacterium cyanobacteriorum]OYQ31858.1 hypothetical protein CHU92_15295 [Flavobacterium cyanobacteriorum]
MVKKVLLSLFILLAAHAAKAQILVKGTIKDILTHEAVGNVTISTQDQQYGTVSNDEGSFALSCPASARSIVLNHLSYKPLEIALANLPDDGIYYLEQQQIELDEVIILNMPVHKFLEELRASSIKQFSAPLQLGTYYREFVKNNNSYTKFADALIDYNTFRKGKKIDTELIVKQSRAVRLPGEDEAKYDVVSALDVRKAVSRDYEFRPLDLLLDGKEYTKYNFLVKSRTESNGQVLEYINFEPKAEVQEALYTGVIAYEPKSKRILEIDIALAASHKKYIKEKNFLIIRATVNDVVYKSSFKIVGDKYLLSLSVRDISLNLRNKRTINEDFKFRSDLIVTNYTADAARFNKKEKYKERLLYENGNNYTEKFWVGNNAILLNSEEEQIIKSLEDK